MFSMEAVSEVYILPTGSLLWTRLGFVQIIFALSLSREMPVRQNLPYGGKPRNEAGIQRDPSSVLARAFLLAPDVKVTIQTDCSEFSLRSVTRILSQSVSHNNRNSGEQAWRGQYDRLGCVICIDSHEAIDPGHLSHLAQ